MMGMHQQENNQRKGFMMPSPALEVFEGSPLAFPINDAARREHLPHAAAVVCDTGLTAAHGELCLVQRGELVQVVRVEVPAMHPVNAGAGNTRIALTHVYRDAAGRNQSATVAPDAAYLVRGYFDHGGEYRGIPAEGVNLDRLLGSVHAGGI